MKHNFIVRKSRILKDFLGEIFIFLLDMKRPANQPKKQQLQQIEPVFFEL